MTPFLRPRVRASLIVDLALALALTLLPACATRPRPPTGLEGDRIVNLATIESQIEAYHDSGRWAVEQAGVADRARVALDERLPGVSRPAIVFDIDDTVLSNYPVRKDAAFGFVQALWTKWAETDPAPAIDGTVALYHHALARGVAVFFITGRREPLRAATERQLRDAGVDRWTGLYLEPADYAEPSVVPYKSGVRRKITEDGYRILVNIGDQWSDLEGGFADTTFKLPNPMYFIP
jgi:acid phosphatase